MNISIRLLEPQEQMYTYTQSAQITAQTGCIGHLRADLGSDGESFYSTWDDHYPSQKTPEFQAELTRVINNLRYGPLYVDKNNCILLDADTLLFDDGEKKEIWTLETNAKGYSVSNPDYLKHHPDAEEKFEALLCEDLGNGLRRVNNAALEGLSSLDDRRNDVMCGPILESRSNLSKFCYSHMKGEFGNDREWGIRVDTDRYSYLMRLNPNRGKYNLYCYCYVREWLEQHMEAARHGIRFINPHYEELFRIPDGDMIRIFTSRGETLDRMARYIDEYHVEVDRDLFHICEFAERMEEAGNTVIPLRSSLPETAFVYLPTEHQIGLVRKGESGYYKTDFEPLTTREENEALVQELNEDGKVTKAQAAAMSAGSMFGWGCPAADPASYDAEGVLLKENHKDRGDAR